VDFWQKAKSEIEPIKKITWMAEGDNASYMSVFDCDYAWAFNTSLADFGKNKDLTKLKAACNTLFNNANYKDKSRMVYLTNHDLNAYDGTVFVRFGNSVLPLTVLYFTIYDMPLIYNGQEIGASKAMGLFDVNPVPWTPVNSTIQNLFQKLTRLKRSQPALENGKNRGSLHSYHTTSDRIFVFSRKRENNEVLIMLNFANSPVNFKFNSTAPAGSFSNYLTVSEKQEFNTSNTIHLAANGYAIYIK
jgi:glycosidase